MRTLLAVWLVVGFLSFPMPGPLQAQGTMGPCVDCSDCQVNGVLGNRAYNVDEEDESAVFSRNDGVHESTCYTTGQCIDMHHPEDECYGLETDEDVEEMILLRQISTAVKRGDVALARTLAISGKGGSRVRYLPHRDAIQATGCVGQIVAHFPLGDILDPSRIAIVDFDLD